MTPDEALADIRGYAFAGRVTYAVPHALNSMRKRGATKRDVVFGLARAKGCVHEPAVDRWRVSCLDTDGDELTVIVEIDDGLLVVTAF